MILIAGARFGTNKRVSLAAQLVVGGVRRRASPGCAPGSGVDEPGYVELERLTDGRWELLERVPLSAMLTLNNVLAVVPVDASNRG
jgi:hypothetical protein